MDIEPHRRGEWGERIAQVFLESRGYHILERRFRAGRREIDLVAERGEWLVAVEVKWRQAGSDYGAAAESWRRAQRGRAREAAWAAMAQREGGAVRPWRFDLITIEVETDGLRLVHRRGAWSPGGSWW